MSEVYFDSKRNYYPTYTRTGLSILIKFYCSIWNTPVIFWLSPPISCTKFCHPILTTNLHMELDQEHIIKENL